MGHSIFSENKQELALMQFNNNYALMVKDKVAVLRPGKGANTYTYSRDINLKLEAKHLIAEAHDEELEKDVLAFIIVLNHLYDKGLYR